MLIVYACYPIYREKIIKAEAENAMDADAEMAKQFPYSEMAKFGWVPETREAKEKVVNLRKYFEVVELSLLGSEQITRIACRRLAITEKSDLALIAVVGRGMKSARGTAAILFTALAEARVNIKMIDQGSSELNIIIGVADEDFEVAMRAIYDAFIEVKK